MPARVFFVSTLTMTFKPTCFSCSAVCLLRRFAPPYVHGNMRVRAVRWRSSGGFMREQAGSGIPSLAFVVVGPVVTYVRILNFCALVVL